ncbi:MAG: SNF2-related protein, partial [Acidobacteriota bacterium]
MSVLAEQTVPVPEQGQLVELRRRAWLVKDVHPGALQAAEGLHHRVTLEALDQQRAGEELQVVWEREVHKQVLGEAQLPQPTDQWDSLRRLEAFLLATRWSLASVLDTLPVQAPFRGAIDPEDFQLEAVVRALGMPRVNLLIADFVGAGKTIEAGLVMQELLARQRIRRVLVVCPASLQVQWQEEMRQRFALEFEIVDRDYVNRLRREYGPHVNPWNSHPRLITSMDFLKRIEPLQSFLFSLKRPGEVPLRDWDLLIVDEAHNVAPQGRGSYPRPSDRTRMMREVLPHFEHRLFLTATPHNGFTESFTALLEMLDPLRFTRGPITDRRTFEEHRDAVMI